MNKKPTRKTIRLQGYDYSQAGCYFVTVCVANKKPILSKITYNNSQRNKLPYLIELLPMGVEIEKTINYINENYNQVEIKKYVIMPDHIHLIVTLMGKNELDADRQGCLSLRDVPDNL